MAAVRLPNATLNAEPTWDIARLFPPQGQWDAEDYLALDTNRLIEFSHGLLEVLIMPTQSHQIITRFLFRLLEQFVMARQLGMVLFAPLRIQLWPNKYREPDIVFMLRKNDERRSERFWVGADLVIEVVSPDDRRRDYETKRREYAQAGIPEYWIVDPAMRQIYVLTLVEGQYVEHGCFESGQQADSVLLAGFEVKVEEVFAAAEG